MDDCCKHKIFSYCKDCHLYKCYFCGGYTEEKKDGLCPECYNKINNDETIGYRKNE